MRVARSRSLMLEALTSTIKLLRTLPNWTMARVVKRFNTSLVAVPAFKRVEPVSTSGPTLGAITRFGRSACGIVQTGIETEQHGARATPLGLPQRAPNKRGASAGRNADHHVPAVYAAKLDRVRAGHRIILGPFEGLPKRRRPAGQDALNHVWRHAERGRTLAGIQHPEAAAGAGADVKQASATPESADNELDGAFNGMAFRQQSRGDFGVFTQHQRNGLAQRRAGRDSANADSVARWATGAALG